MHPQSLLDVSLTAGFLILAGVLAIRTSYKMLPSSVAIVLLAFYVLTGAVASNAEEPSGFVDWLKISWWLAPASICLWLVGSYLNSRPLHQGSWRKAVVAAITVLVSGCAAGWLAYMGTVGDRMFRYGAVTAKASDWSNFDLAAGPWYLAFILFAVAALGLATLNWRRMARRQADCIWMYASSGLLTVAVLLTTLNFRAGEFLPETLLFLVLAVAILPVVVYGILQRTRRATIGFLHLAVSTAVMGLVSCAIAVVGNAYLSFVQVFFGMATAIVLEMLWALAHGIAGSNGGPPSLLRWGNALWARVEGRTTGSETHRDCDFMFAPEAALNLSRPRPWRGQPRAADVAEGSSLPNEGYIPNPHWRLRR